MEPSSVIHVSGSSKYSGGGSETASPTGSVDTLPFLGPLLLKPYISKKNLMSTFLALLDGHPTSTSQPDPMRKETGMPDLQV